MRIRQDKPFENGYNSITEQEGKHSFTQMDFGVVTLLKGQSYTFSAGKERALILLCGQVTLKYNDRQYACQRSNVFDESAYCLHVDRTKTLEISCESETCELAYQATDNDTEFDHVFYTPNEVRSEMRGAGTMNETSTRNVRTIFDKSNAPYANLVLGEVIGYPGKWSSYPPHHHPQPEIYFYRFNKPQGFGFSELGEDAVKLKNNDTVIIQGGKTHPQVVAPGYAIYYLWVIRHIDNNPYITPTFVEEHKWVMDKAAVIWPDK